MKIRTGFMRMVFLLLFITLLFSCSEKPDEAFSSSFLLGSVGRVILPVYEPIADPAFSTDETFWTARQFEKRVLTKLNLNGYEENRVTLYLNPASQEIRDLVLSDDGNTALLNIAYDGSNESNICRIVFGTSDHQAFQLDGGQNKMVPNPLSLSISSLTYPWDDLLVYLGTEYDYPGKTAVQRLFYYNFASGSTKVLDLDDGYFILDSEGNLTGNYYHSIDIYRNPENENSINEILVCQRIVTDEGISHTFKILDDEGSVNFDGSGVFEYQEIGGIRWLGNEEVLMTVKRDDRWLIMSVNSDEEEHIFYEASSRVFKLQGLDLSPSSDRCMTRILYDEYGGYSDILILSLK